MKQAVRFLVPAVGLPIIAYFWLGPDAQPYCAHIFRDYDSMVCGWEALSPGWAWPILVIYGAPLLALAGILGWAVGRMSRAEVHQQIAKREAAVAEREQEARRVRQEGETMQEQARIAVAEAARDKQAAATQIDEANTRLQGSVGTNMGRQRQIQNLRGRVKELEERVKELVGQATIGHC